MIRKIKVFLVEDEVIIRSGVKKSINWEQEGYEMCIRDRSMLKQEAEQEAFKLFTREEIVRIKK